MGVATHFLFFFGRKMHLGKCILSYLKAVLDSSTFARSSPCGGERASKQQKVST